MAPNAEALNKLILRLEISHVVFGALCFGRVMYYTAISPEKITDNFMIFLLVSFMMLITSILMLLSTLIEKNELRFIPRKSLFELFLYIVGSFLYFIATVVLVLYLIDDKDEWSVRRASLIGASMFASWNTLTYVLSCWAFFRLRRITREDGKDSDTETLM